MTTAHVIGNEALICHSYNADCSEMVVSINTNDIYLLSVPKNNGEKFKLLEILKKHTMLVTCLDWCHKSNNIVSGSADRETSVWRKQGDGTWCPVLVVLQINRAVTSVKWSPLGNKFAAGSGSKLAAIAYFEEESDWYLSKHIKKSIKSTITCVDWHPNNVLIACGSSDFKVRVYSAFISNVDTDRPDSTWGSNEKVGTLLFEGSSEGSGWVHDVKFSHDGNKLLWLSHNSTVSIADSSSGSTPSVIVVKQSYLPYLSSVWLDDNTFLAGGHDCSPVVYKYDAANQTIVEGKHLDQKSDNKESGKLSAMRKFQDIDRMAAENVGSKLATIHQNSIKQIRVMKESGGKPSVVTSVGLDGLLVAWDLQTLSQKLSGLHIS